ncbi:hypothetical protein [Psychrobacter phenylpyruvicus]|uniref:Uncharacterized protein n=1 Tax=Psychrobacter phenylpyruvicus TaxID=29432 RepID=A0A379LJK9_9GAMM|nr:hypothetical protein [Psychrobacter phenylpyruvicus]SUD90733.1 Uncharacterised protein [Psychrobacter phenylpyruvicus]
MSITIDNSDNRSSWLHDLKTLSLRDPSDVMNPDRLGAMQQTRISFVRTLLRKISREQWQLNKQSWCISDEGYGHAIYRLTTNNGVYHLVVFCDQIADEDRNDRVIAERWDVAFCLVLGEVPDDLLQQLHANIPLQEAGRNCNKVIVLARANKSVRVFEHIVERLASGKQPSPEVLAQVGYILRTTAVYGNGKFGIHDFKPLEKTIDFGQSFSAQMCAVYLLRQFSLDWVEFLAKVRGGDKAVSLHPKLQRYLGVGNATGLGMAPYLINHPSIVDQWLTAREHALATVLDERIEASKLILLQGYLRRAVQHLQQVVTINEAQQQKNEIAVLELDTLLQHLESTASKLGTWRELLKLYQYLSFEAQEVLIACLMELYPEKVDIFESFMNTDETMEVPLGKKVEDIISILENRYQWAIYTDFNEPQNIYWFWYRSEDKEEPRLGIRGVEQGTEKELPLDIGRQVLNLYLALQQADSEQKLSEFILENPKYRGIIRRVWNMGNKLMGDIQMNVLHKEALPMNLLRCKLSMFGATKFDPRSDRWVRITLFQGAPLFNEVHEGEWLFPLLPTEEEIQQGLEI